MYDFFYRLAGGEGASFSSAAAYALSALVLIAGVLVLRFAVKAAAVKIFSGIAKRSKNKWDDIFIDNKVINRLSWFVLPVALNISSGLIPGAEGIIGKTADLLGVALIIFAIGPTLKSADDIYRTYEISKVRPIKGFLQVFKVIVYIVGGIVLVAMTAGESPLVLLGGVGAMTAVTSLIFKDAILGFVAGVQLTSNDMIRIGDWIEMPKYSADGTVTDLSLTTVKVKNFDNTVTSIPAYALVSDAFINWRGMVASGGRRIKRTIFIDPALVKLCDEEMIKRFRRIKLITGYIDKKTAEINAHNSAAGADTALAINGRRLTNIGTFRAYITEYLKNHPGIHGGMILMVRQLAPGAEGIPLEVYAFTNTTKWTDYEGIQADIFDHLYSVIGEFDLALFANPSGNDLRTLRK